MEIITLLREIAPFRKIDEAVEIYAEGSTLYADFYSTNQQLLDAEIDTISVDIMINEQWFPYCDCENLESDLHRFRYILAAEWNSRGQQCPPFVNTIITDHAYPNPFQVSEILLLRTWYICTGWWWVARCRYLEILYRNLSNSPWLRSKRWCLWR